MIVPIFNEFIELLLKYFWPQPVEQLSFKLISIEKKSNPVLNNIRMNRIVWIINPVRLAGTPRQVFPFISEPPRFSRFCSELWTFDS